jgi:hypothetical protein
MAKNDGFVVRRVSDWPAKKGGTDRVSRTERKGERGRQLYRSHSASDSFLPRNKRH